MQPIEQTIVSILIFICNGVLSLIQLLSGFVEICFILKTSYLHKLWPIIGYFTFTINE